MIGFRGGASSRKGAARQRIPRAQRRTAGPWRGTGRPAEETRSVRERLLSQAGVVFETVETLAPLEGEERLFEGLGLDVAVGIEKVGRLLPPVATRAVDPPDPVQPGVGVEAPGGVV